MKVLQTAKSNIEWLKKPQVITAIYSEDFAKLSQKVLDTDSTCFSCQQKINANNLGGWVKTTTGLIPFCDNPSCFPVKLGESKHVE